MDWKIRNFQHQVNKKDILEAEQVDILVKEYEDKYGFLWTNVH